MADELQDWPTPLKRNAAIVTLAHAIFRARGEAYGGSRDLSEQTPSVRATYIAKADEVLKAFAPARVIALPTRERTR